MKRVGLKKGNISAFTRLLKMCFDSKVLFISLILLSVVSSALVLLLPVVIGRAIDVVIAKNNVDFVALRNYIICGLAIVAAYLLLGWATSAINNRITYGVAGKLRLLCSQKIPKLNMLYLDKSDYGALIEKSSTDIEIIGDGLRLLFSTFVSSIISIIGALILMFVYNPIIAAIVFILTPLSIFLGIQIAKKTSKYYSVSSEKRGILTSRIEESISNYQFVNSNSTNQKNISDFEEDNDNLAKNQTLATFYSSLTNPSTRLINNIIYAIIVCIGGLFVLRGAMSVGGLSTILAYSIQYSKPLNELSGVLSEIQNALVCARAVFDFTDIEEETETGDMLDLSENFEIEFSHVWFSYVSGHEILKDVSFKIKSGEHVALVGATGAGKTTIVNLLMRYYEPDKGNIYIDGRDISLFSRKKLREYFGMVLQDPWIEKSSVLKNISIGNPKAGEGEIKEAASFVFADGFISRLPLQYNTIIGNDSNLSAGEKQLISLARLVLKNPRVVILDEATSSLDIVTEQKVKAALDCIAKDKTSLIIAHRLSTIENCDRILVLNKGVIAEEGTNEELLKKEGLYYDLYKLKKI